MPDASIDTNVDLDDEIMLLRADTLRGDIRDRMLERIRTMPKVWEKMSEFEQSEMIHGIDNAARLLVKQALQLVAAEGRTIIEGFLDSMSVKDGIEAKIKVSRKSIGRYELQDSVKKDVLIVVLDTDAYFGESDEARAEPDQPDLLADKPVMDSTAAGAQDPDQVPALVLPADGVVTSLKGARSRKNRDAVTEEPVY